MEGNQKVNMSHRRIVKPAVPNPAAAGLLLEQVDSYYISGDQGVIKKPNIISRSSKGHRLISLGSTPSSLTSVLVPSLEDDDDTGGAAGIIACLSSASTCVSQSIATPIATPSISSDSITAAHHQEIIRRIENNNQLILSTNTLQVLESNNHGNITILSNQEEPGVGGVKLETMDNLIGSNIIPQHSNHNNLSNSMTIQTDDGQNLVLYLHEENGNNHHDDGLFGNDTQIIQTDSFPIMVSKI